MSLIRTADSLLRDRESLYQTMSENSGLAPLFSRLMTIFIITSALYGLGMGAFRMFHPEFVYSDFEIVGPDKSVTRGTVAGVDVARKTVFSKNLKTPYPAEGTIRFNLSDPTEPAKIVSITEEKEFAAITLAPATPMDEPGAIRIPFFVALKTPLLFLLTLLICAPALYVLNLMFDIRLHFMPVMTLMSFALAATGTMLAVFVPIAALFSVVTESYHFMKVFHLLVFAIAGMFGVKVLAEGLFRLMPQERRMKNWVTGWPLLGSWLILYCLVGGQVAWTLKPFLGTPYLPATPPFRIEAGNIYVSAFKSMSQMVKD